MEESQADKRRDPVELSRLTDEDLAGFSKAYGDALTRADGHQAELVAMSILDAGVEIEVLYESVIAPAMWWVGDLWANGALSIADENVATAITLRVMARIYGSRILPLVTKPGRILLAVVEGQKHEIGLRMVGDVLELNGYEVILLGDNLPLQSLLESIERFTPDLIGISSILDANRGMVETAVREIVNRHPKTPVMVGGPIDHDPVTDLETVSRVRGVRGLAGTTEKLLNRWGVDPHREAFDARFTSVGKSAPAGTLEENLLQVVADASEEVRGQARIARSYRQMAHEDPVTRGPNRRAFDDHLERFSGSPAFGPVVLLVLDLDSFKNVNDSLGHEAGDLLLRDVARVIHDNLREEDFAGRLGGDEFGILLPWTSLDEAESIANRMLEAIRNIRHHPPVAATIGVSLVERDARLAMIRADTALYEAKNEGRDLVKLPGDGR